MRHQDAHYLPLTPAVLAAHLKGEVHIGLYPWLGTAFAERGEVKPLTITPGGMIIKGDRLAAGAGIFPDADHGGKHRRHAGDVRGCRVRWRERQLRPQHAGLNGR
ncbi:MAG TPA: hypothetical protein VFQ44_08875 [Streptosporangiaceae bacterium]|nr:hypothetical protein [Streptosporangiaceae bacterium]